MPAYLVDLERVLADELWRAHLMDVSRYRAYRVERFAQALESGIGVHVHPEQIGKLRKLNGFDGGDLHERFPPKCGFWDSFNCSFAMRAPGA